MGDRRDLNRVLVGNLREKDRLGNPGIDWIVIMDWI